MDNSIEHIGVKRRSGRYPWGSGKDARGSDILSIVERLSQQGLSEKEIADSLGISTTQLRNQKSIAVAAAKEALRLQVTRMRESGQSVASIASELGMPDSTVRDLLRPGANAKFKIIKQIADAIAKIIGRDRFVDIGEGTEIHLGVSRTKLDNAVELLRQQGYEIHYVTQPQSQDPNRRTTIKVLGPPGSTLSDAFKARPEIQIPGFHMDRDTDTIITPDDVLNISSKRVLVKYANDGGSEKDGLIELRAGVPEFNMGNARYAQVRIGVDGTHFMKGVAIQRPDLPDGVDAIYYSSKLPTGNKLDAMKTQKEEGASAFGSVVRPNTFVDSNGKTVVGALNIVGSKEPLQEGAWANWNTNLASQVLSKQPPRLAQKQLDMLRQNYEAQFADISALTHPVVRSHLLTEFADRMDSAAVELKAHALPRQQTHVLLPDPTIKPTEIFAPNYKDGESVVLIRYPHGGVFEIPTLTVNNKTSQYRKILGADLRDAVAIHPDVAQRISGADFDGDTVYVIPNNNRQIRTAPALEGLKNFDPKLAYPKYPGMPVMSERRKQREMGDVSNLITDMTIKGATESEIARAVRHSMVVIDAAKHELNYKQSYMDNGIAALKTKYQGSARSGAATIISRAKSQERVPVRSDRYAIDPVTGEKIYTYTGETYVRKNKKGESVEYPRLVKSTKMAETKDPHELSSGTAIETIYADHATALKSMANRARLASLEGGNVSYSPAARKTYTAEVESLKQKLREARAAKPLQRKTQALANEIYKSKADANPDMSAEERNKERARSYAAASAKLGTSRPVIRITPREWQAIELGAITPTALKEVLRHADPREVKDYATPRTKTGGMSAPKIRRAKALLESGYTTAQIATALGVSVSQIQNMDRD